MIRKKPSNKYTYTSIIQDQQPNETSSKIKNLVDSEAYLSIMMICVIFALFFDDFRHIIGIQSTEWFFNILTILVIIFFILGRIKKRHDSTNLGNPRLL